MCSEHELPFFVQLSCSGDVAVARPDETVMATTASSLIMWCFSRFNVDQFEVAQFNGNLSAVAFTTFNTRISLFWSIDHTRSLVGS